MNQVIAAAALQLLQQQNNPQIPVQMQNNNLAVALVQMAGMLGAQNMPSYQAPLQQMYPQNPMMNVNQVPSQQYPQIYPQQQGIPFQCPPLPPQQGLPFQHSQPQQQQQRLRPQQLQQQQQPASSVQAFSVLPSSQPGAAGNAQVRPSNMNLNPGNGVVPNQGQGILAAPASTGQSAMLQNSLGMQNLQPVAPTNFPVVAPQPWMNMQMSGQWRPPVNNVPDLCHLGSKDSAGKFQGYGRGGPSNMRGWNQTPYARNQRGNMGPSARNGGQGRQQRGQNRLKDYDEEPKQEFPKIKYTEKEVTEWREARKRNYPTKATGKKRFGRGGKFVGRGGKFAGRRRNNKVEDEETKLRREQLKEILAKQSELGVEVAEVPRWYLAEPKETFKKPHPKRPKRDNEASTSKGVSAKKPTLLEKLHEPEIMRDKSRVLQVLKFMALNNFFEQPNEPLKFPVVMLEGKENDGGQSESEGGDEVAERVDVEDEDKGEVAEGDDVKDEDKKVMDKPEEGEITE